MTCPLCSHAKPLSGCSACVCAYCTSVCVCVYGREGEGVGDGWRQSRTRWLACHQRSQKAQTCQQMYVSALVTAAVQHGDSPSSANEERQYGNVVHLCQRGTFSSALVYFFGFRWKERKTVRVHERSPLKSYEC